MTPETLKYLEGVLTKRILENVDELPSGPETNVYTTDSEPYKDMLKASTALKEVQHAIRRAETRAAREQKRS